MYVYIYVASYLLVGLLEVTEGCQPLRLLSHSHTNTTGKLDGLHTEVIDTVLYKGVEVYAPR